MTSRTGVTGDGKLTTDKVSHPSIGHQPGWFVRIVRTSARFEMRGHSFFGVVEPLYPGELDHWRTVSCSNALQVFFANSRSSAVYRAIISYLANGSSALQQAWHLFRICHGASEVSEQPCPELYPHLQAAATSKSSGGYWFCCMVLFHLLLSQAN